MLTHCSCQNLKLEKWNVIFNHLRFNPVSSGSTINNSLWYPYAFRHTFMLMKPVVFPMFLGENLDNQICKRQEKRSKD